MKKKLKYIYASLFVWVFNTIIFAQFEDDNSPPAPETEGAMTPIDMYEGILMIVAVAMIVGYYFYKRNRRLAN